MKVRNERTYALRIHDTNQLVNPGEFVEVAGPLGKALCEQPANWSAMKATKKAPTKPKNTTSEED